MNNDFEKKLNLCLSKLNKEIDLDWAEIAEELGIECSSDHLRKLSYGYQEYDEYIKNKTKDMLSEEQYQKLLDKELEIRKEKVKLTDLKTHINKKVREYSRAENLCEILREKIEELPQQMINMNYIDRFPSMKDGVLLISDIHYGLKTHNAMKPYDSDICKDKMNYLIDKTIEYSKFNDVDKLHVLLLGDELSGLIHNTTRLEQREDIISQILEVSELISESIKKLADNLPYIILGISQGNHSRVIANKNDSLEHENFTRLIKEFITLKLKGVSNIVILENKFDESIIELNIKGKNLIGLHGHNDRLSNVSKLTQMFDRRIDYVCFGHYHNAKEFENNNTEVIVNGCFSGDDYSKRLRLYNKPIQKLMIFTDEGRIATYNINLDLYNKINN